LSEVPLLLTAQLTGGKEKREGEEGMGRISTEGKGEKEKRKKTTKQQPSTQ